MDAPAPFPEGRQIAGAHVGCPVGAHDTAPTRSGSRAPCGVQRCAMPDSYEIVIEGSATQNDGPSAAMRADLP